MPKEWGDVSCIARSGCRETLKTDVGIKEMITWTFDQGGPVLGYRNEPCGLADGQAPALDRIGVNEVVPIF